MTLRLPKAIVLFIALAVPAILSAQATASSSEEERLEKLMADSVQWYVPRTTVSIGFRVLNSGGEVRFGSLGTVAFGSNPGPISAGAVDRLYDNGAVRTDSPRLEERDANGNQTSTPGGRYPFFTTVKVEIKDSNGNVTGTQDVQVQVGDFLAYTPGLTRSWAYGAASQLTADGRIALSTYAATSEGASAMKESGIAAGVEFNYVRQFSKPAARLQWGLLAGVTLSGINSKTVGAVTSTLHTRTDYYSLNGKPAPTAPYGAPSFDDYLSDTGQVLLADGLETTTPIVAVPNQHTESTKAGGVIVNGSWQVKGAYFMMKLGPTIRTQLTNRIGVSASAGYAGAYAGTTYSVAESFQVPDLEGVLVGADLGTEQTSAKKFLSGYFADLNVEFAASERTGLFGGLTAQKFDGYDQMVGSRTARIDLGSSVGLRGGVSIKF